MYIYLHLLKFILLMWTLFYSIKLGQPMSLWWDNARGKARRQCGCMEQLSTLLHDQHAGRLLFKAWTVSVECLWPLVGEVGSSSSFPLSKTGPCQHLGLVWSIILQVTGPRWDSSHDKKDLLSPELQCPPRCSTPHTASPFSPAQTAPWELSAALRGHMNLSWVAKPEMVLRQWSL